MENQFNMNIKSEILERQADYLFSKAYQALGEKATAEEVSSLVSETIKRYYMNLGNPLTVVREAEPGHLPFVEEYNSTLEEIAEDISILFNETESIGTYLSDYFNYAQSEKSRIESRIKGVSGLASDLSLIANDESINSLYFRDSFNDVSGIEKDMIMGEEAQISTNEGIVTLARSETINRSKKANVKILQGNGEAGTYHLVRNMKVTHKDGTTKTSGVFLSEQGANDDVTAILDGNPSTIFEYQMVNTARKNIVDIAKGYDFDWASGDKVGDNLRLKLVIELEEAEDINWININPYHPAYSNGQVTVYSIRTSEDGFEYSSLYADGKYILNSEINTTPQTYRVDAIFDGNNDFTDSKFSGQGVWSFPTRKAKYVEIVLDQPESYEEKVGHIYYQRVKKDKDGKATGKPVRIKSSDVPDSIRKAINGEYNLNNESTIIKDVESFDGWRYAIGLRDINIMSYQFKEKSEIVTKLHITEEPIQKIMLYVNEKIPQEYLSTISTSNDWIQYYISIDDVNWHRISPMHHQPTTLSGEFPPKIYEINGNKTDLESSFQLYKGHLESDKDIKSVRLKVLFQRPTDIEDAEDSTPILEDYALRVVLKETDL